MAFEKLFEQDCLSKRERVERALSFQPVDRVPLHEQVSYNPEVIASYNSRQQNGFAYTAKEIGNVARQTLDIAFPLFAPLGTGTTEEDGILFQNENWTRWIKSRPFSDEHGAAAWLQKKVRNKQEQVRVFNAGEERKQYHKKMTEMQKLVGETVLLDICETGFCDVFNKMGLELFSYFCCEYPEILRDYMAVSVEYAVRRARAVADNALMPAILIAEDFCTKQGSIFHPEFLKEMHYPYVKELTQTWKESGLFVIYHTDGNFKKEIPNLMACGVHGFYCLEPNCGMYITELRTQYPHVFFAGGIDGVDLMENGTVKQVEQEVLRVIDETDALLRGGIFIDTSSEINPTIPKENYAAMVQAVNMRRNTAL